MKRSIPQTSSIIRTVILFFLALSALASWFLFSANTTSKDIRNVILISMDTCRADHLSCYGYPQQITPNIDALASESILFSNVYTPVPLTLPAHSSMLTGTIPPHHGVHDNIDYNLNQSNLTLAEILTSHEFTASAVISSAVLDSKFGLNQGFNFYDDRLENKNSVMVNERTGEETNHAAFKWLDGHKDERFFLLLHYYDPHDPYEPPEPFASQYAENLYAGEIAYTDYCVGQVIAKLKKLELYDSALIIVTGDHGEMLGEHGEDTHTYFIYQSALKVPLIFKLPRHDKAVKLDDPVGLIDILPTVCSLLGLPDPSNIQGKDLSPYFLRKRGPSAERYLYCESLFPTKYKLNSLLGVITNGWKYIQTTRPELYDLAADPGETRNLIKMHPNRARIMKDRLKQILENSVRKDNIDSNAVMSQEDKKRLESLGYLATSRINEGFEFDQTKVDPKDLIGFHRSILKGIDLIYHNQLDKAKDLYITMLKDYQHPEIHYRLAVIADKQKDLDNATKHLNLALQLSPEDESMRLFLGSTFAKQGKIDEAIIHLDKALKTNPNCASAHKLMGDIFKFQGKNKKAIHHFNEAKRINPEDSKTYTYLGDIMKRLGKIKEAIAHYHSALKIDPDLKKAKISLEEIHFVIGNKCVQKGTINEAIVHFQEILRLNSNSFKAHTNLGYALNVLGNGDEAIMHYHEAIRINPQKSINAYYNLSCLYSVKNKKEEAVKWLKEAMNKGFNDWEMLKTDKDLENIRNTTYYIEITNRN